VGGTGGTASVGGGGHGGGGSTAQAGTVSYAGTTVYVRPTGGSGGSAGSSVAGTANGGSNDELAGGAGGEGPEPAGGCSVLPQSGCPANQTCVPSSASGAGKCMPSGGGIPGAACEKNSDCAPGLGCARSFSYADVYTCATIADDCGTFGAPATSPLFVDGTLTQVPGKELCIVEWCSPVHPQKSDPDHEACGPGAACPQVGSGQILYTICIKAGTSPLGGPCEWAGDCKAGMDCVHTGDQPGKCTRYCDSAADCVAGQQCLEPLPGWCI